MRETRDKQIGLPLRDRPILLSLVLLQTELDSTQSYYHCLSHEICNQFFLHLCFVIITLVLHFLHWCYTFCTLTALLSATQNRVIFSCVLLNIKLHALFYRPRFNQEVYRCLAYGWRANQDSAGGKNFTVLMSLKSIKPWPNGPASSRKWTQVELVKRLALGGQKFPRNYTPVAKDIILRRGILYFIG